MYCTDLLRITIIVLLDHLVAIYISPMDVVITLVIVYGLYVRIIPTKLVILTKVNQIEEKEVLSNTYIFLPYALILFMMYYLVN